MNKEVRLIWLCFALILMENCGFDVRESVHRDIIMKVTNKMQLYRLIYYS